MAWTSVFDKLPEPGTYRCKNFSEEFIAIYAIHSDGKKKFASKGNKDVTHWKPLTENNQIKQ